MINENDQSNLLDYHLGQLSDAEAREVQDRLASDQAYQAESRSIERMLGLLESYSVDEPADLTGRVLLGVDHRLRPIKMDPEVMGKSGFASRVLSLRDLVAAAAMIAVVFGLAVPTMNRVRESGRQSLCQGNLMNLGTATGMYASSFGGQLPFAGYQAGAYWMPVPQRGVPVVDNRRHAYLLIRQKYANPAWFVCPSRPDGIEMVADRPQAFDTFPEPNNSTYSFQCMAGVRPLLSENPAMPYVADQTPLFAGGTSSSGGLNSPNHGGTGQSVLAMDGRVLWSSSPNVGISGDNIWLIQNRQLQDYKGIEVPVSKTDSFLVH